MRNSEQIKAVDPISSVVLASVFIFASALYYLDVVNVSPVYQIMITACSVIFFSRAVYYLAHPVHLTDEGVVRYRFNRIHQKVLWGQVDFICILTDFRHSTSVSDLGRIVIIPIGVPKYDRKKWFGLQYLFIFRKQVIWVENSKKTRQFIEQHYGEIIKT